MMQSFMCLWRVKRAILVGTLRVDLEAQLASLMSSSSLTRAAPQHVYRRSISCTLHAVSLSIDKETGGGGSLSIGNSAPDSIVSLCEVADPMFCYMSVVCVLR